MANDDLRATARDWAFRGPGEDVWDDLFARLVLLTTDDEPEGVFVSHDRQTGATEVVVFAATHLVRGSANLKERGTPVAASAVSRGRLTRLEIVGISEQFNHRSPRGLVLSLHYQGEAAPTRVPLTRPTLATDETLGGLLPSLLANLQ